MYPWRILFICYWLIHIIMEKLYSTSAFVSVIINHYFNFYYITCRAAKAFLFNWVERFRRQTCHSHHTWSNENVTRLYYSHVAADASGEWIHVEFVSPDSSRLQTRQWRKQWVTRRGFYLFWRFLTLSETKWWYSSSTRVFVFSWRVKSRRLAQLRSALAGEGEATESVIIWLLKTLLRNKFGVFETKRWLFRLIMMESNRIFRRHRHRMTVSGVTERLCWLLTAQRSHL